MFLRYSFAKILVEMKASLSHYKHRNRIPSCFASISWYKETRLEYTIGCILYQVKEEFLSDNRPKCNLSYNSYII
jgi:hypothetical protein